MNDASRIMPLRRGYRTEPDFADTYPAVKPDGRDLCCTGNENQGRGACPRYPRRARPLFAEGELASRAIAVALVIACTVVAWLLVSGR